jgi:hypothetical protein
MSRKIAKQNHVVALTILILLCEIFEFSMVYEARFSFASTVFWACEKF